MSASPAPHVYAVILAGGSGTRFWPKSRLKRPKQLCRIGDRERSLIERTLARLDGFIPAERRIIVTHVEQLAETKRIVGEQCKHFLAEPEARNTAAALALAALEIKGLNGGDASAVMVSLHADHVIKDEAAFRADLKQAVEVARAGYLTLVGIKPTAPATGFGYIEKGAALGNQGALATAFRVASFREKPKLDLAKQFLEQGTFYWNSGYFIWRVDTILKELDAHLPQTSQGLAALTASGKRLSQIEPRLLAEVYRELPKIAIDNAVLEQSDNVAFLAAHFDWHDVGSWDAVENCTPADAQGNVIAGDVFTIDTKACTIDAESMFVACIGVKDLVVVQSGNAILVCPKSRAQDVKQVVEHLQAKKRTELL